MSSPWVAPQGRSGEIDLIETCRGSNYKVQTAIICKDHPHPDCYEQHWALGESSLGAIHLSATIDETGTWRMQKCSLERTRCTTISVFPNYLSTVYPTRAGRSNPFFFVSDIWNGRAGDAGWNACGKLNKDTQCRYAVKNVTITSKDGKPIFSDSRCNNMDAQLRAKQVQVQQM